MKKALLLATCLLFTNLTLADDDDNKLGMAGLLSGSNKVDLPEVILSVGEPLGGPWELKSGTYYEVEITADGSGEIGLDISAFSRAVWIDEIVIEGLEIRPYGVESIEFDDAGTMEIGFIAVKPGRYTIHIPGSTGESQKLEVEIK
ncbi:MAG: FIG00992253: hypothetical protein [uncultured Thiotrichaceae bacterium]|uniref:Uncharacterized protein n=1 Tax=uncultured Thiotrichaceae bacterium TaxID=298394 RepID=A0A6S6TJ01_9GAMM|nr:MAG: FIG00992253: hypothetical protein [uncultured Thiotrichaceae bacterium]